MSFRHYLEESAVSQDLIDRFLKGPSWAQFDPELGYILGQYLPTDGLDGSATISTVQANGARTSFVYTNRPCRINTYGDSFTQCHQVSDAETWQEYLAGHLGEPIRNFGMGGYGVYQSYRRMIREEATDHAADYLIFYIWGDDHTRSLLRCRHADIYRRWNHQGGRMFHNNFWPNIEMDLETGQWVEHENRLATRESLSRMTDPAWMAEALKDDLALQLSVFRSGYIDTLDRTVMDRLAARMDFTFDWSKTATLRAQAGQLLDVYSQAATRFILKKVQAFAELHQKQLMIVLFDPYRVMTLMQQGNVRYDQATVEFLEEKKFNVIDMNLIHLMDFEKYNLSFDQYKKEYFIGHYSPSGNHFFAYAIKDRVVAWLDPKPVTYRKVDAQSIHFRGYLEDYD